MKTVSTLWDSPHRIFFLLTIIWALLSMLLWGLTLFLSVPFNPPGGPLLWHIHEFLFALSGAAIIGFMLTAVPEFTSTEPVNYVWLKRLAGLWLAGRVAYITAHWLTPAIWLAAMADTLMLITLLTLTTPVLWQDLTRKHLSLPLALLLLLIVNVMFYYELPHPGRALQSTHLLMGTLMILLLLALARISMSMVNSALEEKQAEAEPYLARPPRRQLAIICILLFSVCSWYFPAAGINAWLALAAAAAILNILNDWHLGRVLLRRWVLLPYCTLWLMAAGYAQLGISGLLYGSVSSGGQHLLAAALMTAIIYVVLVAGGVHSGWGLDERKRVIILIATALLLLQLRALASLVPAAYYPLLAIAAGGWMLSWLLVLTISWRTLWQRPA